ncbi:MAG: hypothetical protein ACRDSH_17005 [Pseudonocardiaceae bacterium]
MNAQASGDQARLNEMLATALERPGVKAVLDVYAAAVERAQPQVFVVQPTPTVANANDLAR